MKLQVKEMIGPVPFLLTRKNMCQQKVSFSSKNHKFCIPRGSTFGFLLFLIYKNELKNTLDKCIVQNFADDTNLLFGNKCLSEISCFVNNDLKLLTG